MDFSRRLFRKDLRPSCLADFWIHLFSQFWCSFIICIITYFSYLEPRQAFEREYFTEIASGFQLLAVSKRKLHLRCLTVFWMYFLIQLQCCFTISVIIHFDLLTFFILSFHFFIILTLIALNELLCVTTEHLFWYWVTLLFTLIIFHILLVFYLTLF